MIHGRLSTRCQRLVAISNKENEVATAADSPKKVVTGTVRLCFPYLFEPRPVREGQTGEPKYGVQVLIPKTDKATIAALRKAEKWALDQAKTSLFGGKVSGLAPSIIKDADEDGSAEDYPERKGHLYMNVQTANKPEVVDESLQSVLSRSEAYSGVYGRVSVGAFAYKSDVKKGISFGLNNVQVFGYGDNLMGGSRAVDDFGTAALDEESAALL